MKKALFTLYAVLAGLTSPLAFEYSKPLTFEDRVKAQEAIERVYYNHRIWPKENPQPKPPFEQMLPKSVIEAKVTDSLKKSSALDKFWQRPLTGEQLQAEMDRMAKNTKDPETLMELFAAIDNDPYLIAECLARPILADRLVRNWYVLDERFHGEEKKAIEETRRMASARNFRELAPDRFNEVAYCKGTVSEAVGNFPDGLTLLTQDEFAIVRSKYPAGVGEISEIQEDELSLRIRMLTMETEESFRAGQIVILKKPFEVWYHAVESALSAALKAASDGSYRLAPSPGMSLPSSPDSWAPIDTGSPEARADHTAVWTGSEMIVWGGEAGSTLYDNGRCYDPATDTWRTVSSSGCPAKRISHAAIWTGTEMIIWGGWNKSQHYDTGGRYNPVSDAWMATSAIGAPSPRKYFTAVWTGSEMIVWGGENGVTPFYTGGRYKPEYDTWTETDTDDPDRPTFRSLHTAVWTSQYMLVWGGLDPFPANTGAMYDPASDSWAPISTADAPSARYLHSCVWTGSEMIVWGGRDFSIYCDTGARYDPNSNSWVAIPPNGAPSARSSHTAVWSGSEMIVWGGDDGTQRFDSGKKYIASSNSWTSLASLNAPVARINHSAIWTETEMIIWGGCQESNYLCTGGRYNPSSDSWTATAIVSSPSQRTEHAGGWTGAEMVIWGGQDGSGVYANTGGMYSAATDSWQPTGIEGAPSQRGSSMGIWTGETFVVWGGWDGSTYYDTGGRYNPTNGSWASVSQINAPSPRKWFSSVWTGSEIIVWGGSNGSSPLDTGGRYSPAANEWVTTNTEDTDRPTFRSLHQAVWTGEEMVVWGGLDPFPTSTGAKYNPSDDSWLGISESGAPTARYRHSAAWTGSEMVVWGGRDLGTCMASGGRYDPESNSWMATSDVGAPSIRSDHIASWSGMEAMVWGGECDANYAGDGASYSPDDDSWTAISHGSWEPSARSGHVGMWNGEALMVWGGGTPPTNTGSIYFPNTAPRAIPLIVTSEGGDATFAWGTGESLALNGQISTDGSNPQASIPYHDALDSLLSYEWDLNADALFDTLCTSATVGVDKAGSLLSGLTETDLRQYGIDGPGVFEIWLRVADELGSRNCNMTPLTVVDGIPPTVTLQTPNGGDRWEYSQDDLHRRFSLIDWSADDNASISRILLSYSSDGGMTWACIADSKTPGGMCAANGLTAEESSHEWQMPTQSEALSVGQILPTSTALVSIQIWDQAGNSATDISDGLFFIKSPTITATKTLIAVHSDRIEGLYPGQSVGLMEKLGQLAQSNQVNGVVLDLKDVPVLSSPDTGLYHLWDLDPHSAQKANAVANGVRDHVKSQVESTFTQAEYLVIVGDDRIVPHYRISDPIYFSELDYAGDVYCGSTVGSAICANYYLSDNIFADLEYDDTNRGSHFIALPDLATGRLVETPCEMEATINTFLLKDGQVTLDKVFVAGYDFLSDSATEVRGSFAEAGKATDSLLGSGWGESQLDSALFSAPPHTINNMNDHSDHHSFGTPGGPLEATSMDAHAGRPLEGSAFYNVGCHSGLNVPDTWAPEKHPLDLPQLMLRKGAVAYVGNTGFGWGLKHGVGYSERLMELITDQLLSQDSCSLGDALGEAKREYFVQNHRYDVFDEKVLFESTLYGLPMYQVVVGSSLVRPKDNMLKADGPDYQEADGIAMKKSLMAADETNSLPPGVTELTLNFDFGPEVYQKETTEDGEYYTINGRSSGEIGDTLQPMFIYNSQLSDTACHGVVFTGGNFTAEGGFVPVVGVPMSNNEDPGSGPIAPGMGGLIGTISVHSPDLPNSGQEAEKTRLTVYTGYYDGSAERKFDQIGFVVYYSNSPDEIAPEITDPGPTGVLHAIDGLDASFSVEALDASGVYRVIIAYTDGISQWESLDLSLNSSSGMWEGGLALKRDITYFVQAIDNAGNAGLLLMQGPDLDGDDQPYGSDYSTSRMFSIALADGDGDGMPDPWEIPNGLNPSVNDASGDPDGDLLTNIEEYNADSDPQNMDTDADGDNDGSEEHNGRSPVNPLDGKEIALLAVKQGENVGLEWLAETGQNSLIDGPYWVYRSTSPEFLPSDALAGMPLSETVTDLIDSTATGAPLYFYTVTNVPFTLSPVVEAISPSSGSASGGTSVNIYGMNFRAGATVKIGGNLATNVVVVNDIKITCKTPAGTVGYKDVRVTNPDGKYGTLAGGFRYY